MVVALCLHCFVAVVGHQGLLAADRDYLIVAFVVRKQPCFRVFLIYVLFPYFLVVTLNYPTSQPV